MSYYDALHARVGGNRDLDIGGVYIAAQSNQLNGASFTAAQSAFDAATALLGISTPSDVAAYKTLQDDVVKLAVDLDAYDNGSLKPNHCRNKWVMALVAIAWPADDSMFPAVHCAGRRKWGAQVGAAAVSPHRMCGMIILVLFWSAIALANVRRSKVSSARARRAKVGTIPHSTIKTVEAAEGEHFAHRK